MRSRTDNQNDDDDADVDDKRRSRTVSAAAFPALANDEAGVALHCNSDFFAR